MNQQLLNEFEAHLKRFAEAKDPRNILVITQGIKNCLNGCEVDDKELLIEMVSIFYGIRDMYKDTLWGNIDQIFEQKVLRTIDRYLPNRKSAKNFLKDSASGQIPVFIIKHLSRRYNIAVGEIRELLVEV
jgi:hypothetical protein